MNRYLGERTKQKELYEQPKNQELYEQAKNQDHHEQLKNQTQNQHDQPETLNPTDTPDRSDTGVRERINGWSEKADDLIQNSRFHSWPDRIKRFSKLDLGKSAAASCFYILFSVFPLIILAVNIINLMAPNLVLQIEENSSFIQAFIPEQIWYFLLDFIESASRSSAHIATLSAAVIGLIWAASKGVGAIIGSLHSIYNSERRASFFLDRLFGILAILVIAVLLLAILLFLSFSRPILNWIEPLIALPEILAKDIFSIATSLIATGALTLVFVIIYQVLSRNRSLFRFTLLCGFLAAVGWLIISSALSIFFEYRAEYYSMYGNVTGIIFLMLWLFMANYILMAGAFAHTEFMRKYPKPLKIK